ncbi:invasion protein, partial [Photobacterium damselae]
VGKNKVFKTFAFLGALGWLVLAAKLAVTKVPLFG